MSDNPYRNLPPAAFWKSGVEASNPFNMQGIYLKKWSILPKQKIATAGSCFAQHISRFMFGAGYQILNVEPTPGGLPQAEAQKFGYSMYSGRYGNIYTLAQLLQLLREAAGTLKPAQEDVVWQRPDGRYIDAFRPGVEPQGLSSPEEVLEHRAYHLAQVRRMFEELDILIFTMGLTETWANDATGLVYPSAPGVFGGTFDADAFSFRNLTSAENIKLFRTFNKELVELRGKKARPRYLLTVSPVPLTATASGKHVLPSTVYSKSVLRGVAGQLADEMKVVDYFPSFEIITNQAARSAFYEQNLRSVRADGVESVMRVFFAEHPPLQAKSPGKAQTASLDEEDVQCEEAVLEAFGQ